MLVCFVFRAAVLGCINSQWPDKYGHYREAKYTQTKHHWFWKVWPHSHQGVHPNSDFMLQIHCPRDYWGCFGLPYVLLYQTAVFEGAFDEAIG